MKYKAVAAVLGLAAAGVMLAACGKPGDAAAAPVTVTAPTTVVQTTAKTVPTTVIKTVPTTKTVTESADTDGMVTVECADLYAKTDTAFALYNVAIVSSFNSLNHTSMAAASVPEIEAATATLGTASDAFDEATAAAVGCGVDADPEFLTAAKDVATSSGDASSEGQQTAQVASDFGLDSTAYSVQLSAFSDAVDLFQSDYGTYLGVRTLMW